MEEGRTLPDRHRHQGLSRGIKPRRAAMVAMAMAADRVIRPALFLGTLRVGLVGYMLGDGRQFIGANGRIQRGRQKNRDQQSHHGAKGEP